VAFGSLVLAMSSSNTSASTSHTDSLLDLLADRLLVLLGPVQLLSSNAVDFLLR
jgi:hypothetical protein